MSVDLLILGAGWTSNFLIPLCKERGIKFAATSRSGRDATVPFLFNPDSEDRGPYEALPDAQTILITFPIKKSGASQRLVNCYTSSRKNKTSHVSFIQLGATSIWDQTITIADGGQKSSDPWCDRRSPHNNTLRATCEDELLALSPNPPTAVLNLSGLWGGERSPRNWVARVAPTKEALRKKGSIHLIHGTDVARAILAVHGNFLQAQGQRWILTDCRVYDWWDLALAWGAPPSTPLVTAVQGEEGEKHSPQQEWVRELIGEEGVRALPRSVELLGRALDSRDFWKFFGLSPVRALLGC